MAIERILNARGGVLVLIAYVSMPALFGPSTQTGGDDITAGVAISD